MFLVLLKKEEEMIDLKENLNEATEEVSNLLEGVKSDEEYSEMGHIMLNKFIRKFVKCSDNQIKDNLQEINVDRGILFNKLVDLYFRGFGVGSIEPLVIKKTGETKMAKGSIFNYEVTGGIMRAFDYHPKYFSPPIHLLPVLIIYYALSVAKVILTERIENRR